MYWEIGISFAAARNRSDCSGQETALRRSISVRIRRCVAPQLVHLHAVGDSSSTPPPQHGHGIGERIGKRTAVTGFSTRSCRSIVMSLIGLPAIGGGGRVRNRRLSLHRGRSVFRHDRQDVSSNARRKFARGPSRRAVGAGSTAGPDEGSSTCARGSRSRPPPCSQDTSLGRSFPLSQVMSGSRMMSLWVLRMRRATM